MQAAVVVMFVAVMITVQRRRAVVNHVAEVLSVSDGGHGYRVFVDL